MSTAQMTKRITIRTDADAIAWLQENQIEVVIKDGKAIVDRVCGRCLGSGRYSFNLMDGDRCYGCFGTKSRWTESIPVVSYARELKTKAANQARAAAKAQQKADASLERQRDWCEANGFGRITFLEKNDIVKKQREEQREEKKGIAPEGRIEFSGKVVKFEERQGYCRGTVEWKMTVVVEQDGKEWLAWGSVPRDLLRSDDFGKGAIVSLTASLVRSDKANFAFFKRPADAKVVVAAPVVDEFE